MNFEDLRTDEQNRLMWSCLHDLEKQLLWPVDGEMVHLDAEDWKHVMTAGLKKHQRMAKGIDGGFVILGQSTRKLKKPEMSMLLEIIFAFGAEHGVMWSEQRQAA